MEVEARDPKVEKVFSLVQHVQTPKGTGRKIWPDTAAGALLEEFFQALVPKAPDHSSECNALGYRRRAAERGKRGRSGFAQSNLQVS